LQLGQSQKLAAKERKTALQARRAQTLQELQSNENYRKLRAEIVNLYVTALKKDLEKVPATFSEICSPDEDAQ
jgi:hypothetical protein